MEASIIVEWILANRRGGAFSNYNREQIEAEVEEAARKDTIIVSCKEDGTINGIIIYEARIHVKQMLCKEKGIFQKLVRYIHNLFPDFKFQAARKHNKLSVYCNHSMFLKNMNKITKSSLEVE